MCMYLLTTDQSGIHACIHTCKHSSTCPFLHGVICSEGHADTHAPMHLCIVWASVSLNVSMPSCIHPDVCGCSHTCVHPILDLRLSNFSISKTTIQFLLISPILALLQNPHLLYCIITPYSVDRSHQWTTVTRKRISTPRVSLNTTLFAIYPWCTVLG